MATGHEQEHSGKDQGSRQQAPGTVSQAHNKDTRTRHEGCNTQEKKGFKGPLSYIFQSCKLYAENQIEDKRISLNSI